MFIVIYLLICIIFIIKKEHLTNKYKASKSIQLLTGYIKSVKKVATIILNLDFVYNDSILIRK